MVLIRILIILGIALVGQVSYVGIPMFISLQRWGSLFFYVTILAGILFLAWRIDRKARKSKGY